MKDREALHGMIGTGETRQFPVPDVAYAVGRVSVLEKTLLDRNTWITLSEMSYEDAQALVEAHGYTSDDANVEHAIAKAQQNTIDTLCEITQQRHILELFLLPTDAHNLNVLIKSIIMRTDPGPLLMDGGAYDRELLRMCVEHEDYTLLGEEFEQELAGILTEESPRKISAAIDRAIFAHIRKVIANVKIDALKEYFDSKADAVNALAESRGKALGWDDKKIGEMKVPAPGTHVFQIQDDFSAFERELNRKNYRLLADRRFDSDGIVRIICYLLAKTGECRSLRLLFASKAAGIPVTAEELFPEGVA